jgi:hypothetical protein
LWILDFRFWIGGNVGLKKDFKKVGGAVKKAAKTAGKDAKKAGKAVGKAAKKAGKAVVGPIAPSQKDEEKQFEEAGGKKEGRTVWGT